jgi:GPH family glycoside/pentoside/hexuronide:cation symporter
MPERQSVPLPLQLFYAIGEMPITLIQGLIGTFILFFYSTVMGLPGELAGLGVSAGLVVDALLDPYIGFRSDRSQMRLGRRQSFMLFGAIGTGPLFFLLMNPPRGMTQTMLFAWLLLTSMAFRFCAATYRIPYLSLGAEMTTDYDLRTRVIAIRSLFGLTGLLMGNALPFILFFSKTTDGSDPKLQYAGYPKMGLVFGALMTLCGIVAVFGTQSRKTFGNPNAEHEGVGHFFRGLWLFLKNRQFRTLLGAFALFMLAVVVNFSLVVHYLKWYAKIANPRALSGIQASFAIGAVVGVVAWIWISKRGEKRNLLMGSTLCLSLLLMCTAIFVGEGTLLGTGDFRPLLIGNFVAGLFASALWVLPFSMMADVADEDQLLSGVRREGTMFGIMNFGEKLAVGGALQLSGLLLSRFVHLQPGSEAQTAETIHRIGISYGFVSGGLLAASALLMIFYTLNRKRVAEIQEQLTPPVSEVR